MRLIDANKVVHDFKIEFCTSAHDENDRRDHSKLKYAILSHTWGWQDENTGRWAHKVDEVTYDTRENFSNPLDFSLHSDRRRAYGKVYYACCRAIELGCNYIWIDSCCIDRSNSAELTESINSMFRWYSEADVCLIHLVDSCSQTTTSERGVRDPCRRLYTNDGSPCRWFSRCWTLQELLAGRRLVFYGSEWDPIGTLSRGQEPVNLCNFGRKISIITRIDDDALLGRVCLSKYPVEAKMSWAASRKSERPEDVAYSLLGLFDIHIPLIYGEGARSAFRRLQLEIIKSTPDLSLFAWHTGGLYQEGHYCSILADSPSQFKFHRRVCRSISENHYTMTNKGIHMTSVLHRAFVDGTERHFLCLEYRGETSNVIGIFLRKIGYNVFQRLEESVREIRDLNSLPSTHQSTFYITTSPQQHDPNPLKLTGGSIYVPPEYFVRDVIPEASWDCESRILMGSMPCNDGVRALKLSMNSTHNLPITVGLVFRSTTVMAFDCEKSVEISQKVFTRTHRRILMNWRELRSGIPEIHSFNNLVRGENDNPSLRFKVERWGQYPLCLLVERTKTLVSGLDPIPSMSTPPTASIPDSGLGVRETAERPSQSSGSSGHTSGDPRAPRAFKRARGERSTGVDERPGSKTKGPIARPVPSGRVG